MRERSRRLKGRRDGGQWSTGLEPLPFLESHRRPRSPYHLLLLAVVALVHLDLPLQPSDFGVDGPGAAAHLLPLGADLGCFAHTFLSSHVRSRDTRRFQSELPWS